MCVHAHIKPETFIARMPCYLFFFLSRLSGTLFHALETVNSNALQHHPSAAWNQLSQMSKWHLYTTKKAKRQRFQPSCSVFPRTCHVSRPDISCKTSRICNTVPQACCLLMPPYLILVPRVPPPKQCLTKGISNLEDEGNLAIGILFGIIFSYKQYISILTHMWLCLEKMLPKRKEMLANWRVPHHFPCAKNRNFVVFTLPDTLTLYHIVR